MAPDVQTPTTQDAATRVPDLAVLWDLDGTLIDSEPLLFEAERAAVAVDGLELTPELKSRFVGLGGHEVLAAIADAFGVDADLDAWAARKSAAYLDLLDTVPPFAPTVELARRLAAAGVPMAVASGSPVWVIRRALVAIGLVEAIPVHVSVADVAAGKPAPDVFLEAAARLGVPPQRCVVVEDAVPGVLAAKAAGMRCIAIPYLHDPLDERFGAADLLVAGGMASADGGTLFDWLTTT
ncbi:MAG: HAD family phosphatase [Actinobacteria bacterium]|nr:HAD family phosphatase [Actinomycetota bacterium]